MPDEAVDVTVTLTPAQAGHVAGTLRAALAMEWERTSFGSTPCREEVQRARALLEHYGDQLDRLKWGAPQHDLSVHWRSDVLSKIIEDLRQGAGECCEDAASEAHANHLFETARTLAAALRRHAPVGEVAVAG